MPRATPLQAALNAGEFGPRMVARTDFAKYPFGCATLENMIPLPQGGVTRRPGTRFVAEVKDSAKFSRPMPFQFSNLQAYVLEAGDGYFRFYRDQGQIVVADTDATIANGTFDSGIAGWSDNSTGAASISHSVSASSTEGTWPAGVTADDPFGDANSNRLSIGMKFRNASAGTVSTVMIRATNVFNGFSAVAAIYADDTGSPGPQVGGNSDVEILNTQSTNRSFSWSTDVPTLSADTDYWLVLSDVTGVGVGNINIAATNDQGSAFASGANDIVTSIADGTGGFPGSWDWLFEISLIGIGAEGELSLNGAPGEVAIAEQAVTTSTPGTEHVLAFEVRGTPGDAIKLRVGEVSGGAGLVDDRICAVGWHVASFTPTVSPFFVQFRNESGKTLRIDNVRLLDGEPVELATPYGDTEIGGIKSAQSADVLYLTHPNHPVHRLSRFGHASWSFEQVRFRDGPYIAPPADPVTTLQPSAASGDGITITANDPTDLSDGKGFLTSDVGRLIRIKHGSTWGHAIITSVSSNFQVVADVLTDFGGTSADIDWQIGAWSQTTGYPSTVTFYEQRLVFAGTASQPQSFWMSQSGDFENMRPDSIQTSGDPLVEDDDALDFTISADFVNVIRWLAPAKHLCIGTNGGEWLVKSTGALITPTDIDVKRQTTYGSAEIDPQFLRGRMMFIQRAARKVLEFLFDFNVDNYQALDMTLLADHIGSGGFRDMAYQQEPDSTLWCVRNDGTLCTLTFQPDQDVIGWSRQILGGAFDGGQAVVEGVAVIPGEAQDEVWIAVKRTIGGVTRRFFEVLSESYRSGDDQALACYVDAAPVAYMGPETTSLGGLDHLEGAIVSILADGAVHPPKPVSNGAIALDEPATHVVAGLGYAHRYESLKWEAGMPGGTAQGQVKRINGVTLMLLDSLGSAIGSSDGALRRLVFRGVNDEMDRPVALFTGEIYVEFDGDYATDTRVVIEGNDPLPFTLLGLVPELKTSPR